MQTVNTALNGNTGKRRAKAFQQKSQVMCYKAGYLESLYADSMPGSPVVRSIQDLLPRPALQKASVPTL